MSECKIKFYFGRLGQYSLLAGLLFFLVPAAVLEAGVDGYSLAFFLSIIAGSFFAKDRKEYASAVVEGLSNPMFCTISIAVIYAAIAGKLVSESGIIESFASILIQSGISGGAFLGASFLICCILSVSTGTSVGTYIVSTPLLFPIGLYVGVPPSHMLGAIVSGGLFGDNLSPISDTTIVSAGTQGAEMKSVVKTRCFYSIPAAFISFLLFLFSPNSASAADLPFTFEMNLVSLAALSVPAITVVLCLKGVHLIIALSCGIAAGTAAGLLTGLYHTKDLIDYSGAFEIKGIFPDAVSGTASTIFMLIGAFMFLGLLKRTEILEHISKGMLKLSRSAYSAEAAIALSVGIIGGLTGVCTVGMIAVGEIVRRIGETYHIGACRRANLMDCGGLCLSSIAPWSIHCIYPITLALAFAPEISLSSADVIKHNYYSLIMIPLIFLTILFRNFRPGLLEK